MYIAPTEYFLGFEETLLKEDVPSYLFTHYTDLTEAETGTVIGRLEDNRPLRFNKEHAKRSCL